MPKPNKKPAGKKDNKKGQKDSKAYKAARRRVKLSYRPVLQANKRAQRATQSAYGEGLTDELRGIGQGFNKDIGQLQGQTVAQYGSLTDLLGSAGPASEVSASRGAFGDAGEAMLGLLGTIGAREGAYGASVARQAPLERRAALDNLIQQRQQIVSGMPMEIRDEMRAFQEEALTRRLARQQMESDQAFADFLIKRIRGQL